MQPYRQAYLCLQRKPASKFIRCCNTHINLNDRGSDKTTWHIELAAENLQYQCGDSIGIVPENDSQMVTDIIQVTNADGNKSVEFKKEKVTVYELLKSKDKYYLSH